MSMIFVVLLVCFILPGHSFAPNNCRKINLVASGERYSSSLDAITESMGLNDRFDRWRFLQNLLEGEIENEDVNKVLLEVLNNALARERSVDLDYDNKTEIAPALRKKIETLIAKSEDSKETLDSLQLLDPLIPDHSEDEDASKSLWDTVIEIHGRESMKLNEASATPEWKLSCIKARILLHFDFLTDGL